MNLRLIFSSTITVFAGFAEIAVVGQHGRDRTGMLPQGLPSQMSEMALTRGHGASWPVEREINGPTIVFKWKRLGVFGIPL